VEKVGSRKVWGMPNQALEPTVNSGHLYAVSFHGNLSCVVGPSISVILYQWDQTDQSPFFVASFLTNNPFYRKITNP
jgi:hypothetical protein